MPSKIISYEVLDRRLDRAAREPESFTAKAAELIDELESKGLDLEIRDPLTWRRPDGVAEAAPRTSFMNQFRADVESIVPLGRTEEARLARRIELARMLLQRSLEKNGLGEEDLPDGISFDSLGLDPDESMETGGGTAIQARKSCALPRDVRRRWMVLHALRAEMVERNLYLVLINVERYAHTGAGRLDLIQEGCVSLFRAVDGFDWRRGLLFRTYAVHWLNQAFRNYLYNFSNTVRVPVYLQKAMKHINQAQIRLGDPNASVEDIAKTADLNEGLVSAAMAAARSSFSIDGDSGDEGEGGRLRDLLVQEDDEGPYTTRVEQVSLEAGLEQALSRLNDRERLVVRLRFGLGTDREHTLAEVASELGVSVERVRQIQMRALHKLDTPRFRREMDPYVN